MLQIVAQACDLTFSAREPLTNTGGLSAESSKEGRARSVQQGACKRIAGALQSENSRKENSQSSEAQRGLNQKQGAQTGHRHRPSTVRKKRSLGRLLFRGRTPPRSDCLQAGFHRHVNIMRPRPARVASQVGNIFWVKPPSDRTFRPMVSPAYFRAREKLARLATG
jgi:hypothetical protein